MILILISKKYHENIIPLTIDIIMIFFWYCLHFVDIAEYCTLMIGRSLARRSRFRQPLSRTAALNAGVTLHPYISANFDSYELIFWYSKEKLFVRAHTRNKHQILSINTEITTSKMSRGPPCNEQKRSVKNSANQTKWHSQFKKSSHAYFFTKSYKNIG